MTAGLLTLAATLRLASVVWRPVPSRLIGAPRHWSPISASWWVRVRQGPIERQLADALPSWIEQLARAIRTGASLRSAILQVDATPGALALEISEVRRRLRVGASQQRTLQQWAQSSASRDVGLVTATLRLGGDVGGDVALALDELASALRIRRDASAESRSLATQSRLSGQVIASAPVGLTLVVGLVDPPSLWFFASPVGLVCLIVGAALNLAGAVWMRRIVGAP